jgi:hypothetical protein
MHGKLKRCRFLQTTPVHRADLDKRGPTTWSRLSDKQTQIYPEDLEHESEIVTKSAGDDATSEALNDSFGTFCNIIHDEPASEQEKNAQSSSQEDAQARTLFPSGAQYSCSMNQDEQRWRFIIWAVSNTEYELTLGLQLPRLEEKIAAIDKTKSQADKIKQVKKLLKLGHLASLMDAHTFLKDPERILLATAKSTQLDKTAYRLLKDSMTKDQKSNLNTYMFNRDMDSRQETIQDYKTPTSLYV